MSEAWIDDECYERIQPSGWVSEGAALSAGMRALTLDDAPPARRRGSATDSRFRLIDTSMHADNVLLKLMDEGACSNTDLKRFIGDDKGSGKDAAASALCRACDVRRECLAWAILHDEYGIWGGTSKRQRDSMLAGYRPPGNDLLAAENDVLAAENERLRDHTARLRALLIEGGSRVQPTVDRGVTP